MPVYVLKLLVLVADTWSTNGALMPFYTLPLEVILFSDGFPVFLSAVSGGPCSEERGVAPKTPP
jgi:hypothetical protein